MNAIVAGVGFGGETEVLPVLEKSLAEGTGGTVGGIGGAEDLATEVLPAESGGVELDGVPVDGSGVVGELVAHGHEETVENVFLDAGVIELGAIETAAELLDESSLLHLEVLGIELVRGVATVGGVVLGIVGATFGEDGFPLLAELGLELLGGHVQLGGLLQGSLGGDGVVVNIDVLALVKF